MINDFRSNFRARLGLKSNHDTDGAVDEAVEKRKAATNNHGPRPVRYVTNGQIRRAEARYRKGQQVKSNRRYRRSWMANQQAIANLRGQVKVIDAGPSHPLYAGVEQRLTEAYGSVKKAKEQYVDIVTSQARERKQAAIDDVMRELAENSDAALAAR